MVNVNLLLGKTSEGKTGIEPASHPVTVIISSV